MPSPPKNLHIDDLTKSSVTLLWDKPSDDGGSPVFGYYVEKRQAYSSRFIRVTKNSIRDTMYKVKDLMEDEDYEFQVLAENEAGTSKPSESTGTFTARDPYSRPGKPGKPDAVLKGDTVALSWTRPTEDGRSPITNYVIEMKAVNQVRWQVVNEHEKCTSTDYVVRNLVADCDYEFRVSAENKAGVGVPSSPSKTIRFGKLLVYTPALE